MKASGMFQGSRPVRTGTATRDGLMHEEGYLHALAGIIGRRAGLAPINLGLAETAGEAAAAETAGEAAAAPPAASPLAIDEFRAAGEEAGLRGLERLVRPLGSRAFHQAQYERTRPMLFHGPRGRFHHLVSWETFADFVYNRNLPAEQLRVVQDGNDILPRFYSYAGRSFGSRHVAPWRSKLDPRKLDAFVRNGASVALNGVQTIHAPLRALIDEIDDGMATYANVNLYATWRATPCFSTHWDDHDVFILQVRGQKVWRLWGETRRGPLPRDVESNQTPPPHPIWTGTLDEGDVLYIPRGLWHSAHVAKENDGHGTLHLTVNPGYRAGPDLVRWLEARIAGHERLRRNIPLYANEESLREFLLEYRRVVDAALVEAAEGALARDLQRAWEARVPGRFAEQVDPWRSDAWDDLALGIRGWRQARVEVRPGEDAFTLYANGQAFDLDARCVGLIELLLERGPVRVGEFIETAAAAFPGDFASDFAVQLIKEGIAVATAQNEA